MKILCICTGNSCRSPMAAGFLHSLDARITAVSAGVKPEKAVSEYAVNAMHEIFVDISRHKPKSVSSMEIGIFDLIISCSQQAKQFIDKHLPGSIAHVHISLNDPAMAKGTDDEIMQAYRTVRDEIKNECFKVFVKLIKKQ